MDDIEHKKTYRSDRNAELADSPLESDQPKMKRIIPAVTTTKSRSGKNSRAYRKRPLIPSYRPRQPADHIRRTYSIENCVIITIST